MEKIVLDLETLKTFDEVGGHHNSHLLGVSVCGVYSYSRDQYRAFRQEEFEELLTWLKSADLIIGFNSKHFDFNVLQPYYPKVQLNQMPHLDILEEIVHALGFRLKLESVAQETLGHGKSGAGLDAIRYHRAGEWDKLIKYCLDDVRVTKELYDYGLTQGKLWYSTGGKRESIPIRWQQGESVADAVRKAWAKGQQLVISCANETGVVRNCTIDITSIQPNKLLAYCHEDQSPQVFVIDRIHKVTESGQMASWQQGLF